jgi:hypothetical protein
MAKELTNMRQRRGVALLSVLLVAALVMVAIVVTSSGVAAEKSITTSEWGFKKALSVAETGLTVTAADLRAAVWTKDGGGVINTTDQYLTPEDVLNIAKASVNDVVDCDSRPFPDNRSTYHLKVKKLSGTAWTRHEDYNQTVKVGLYALAESFGNDTQAVSVLLGRRVLYTQANIAFNLHYTPPTEGTPATPGTPPVPGTTAAFNYGLFSGGSIDFKGSPHVVVTKGDIYAMGNIDLGGKDRLDSGHTVYSLGTVTGAKGTDTVKDSGTGGVPSITFPTLSTGFYDQMANDFKTGSNFYSGDSVGIPASAGYPNTRPYTSIIQGYLGAPGVSPTLGGIQSLYTDLKAGTGAWVSVLAVDRADMLSKLKYAVYHVVGGGTIAGQYQALGALVFTGPYDTVSKTWTATTLHLSGGCNILDPGGLAILVNGDIKATGQAAVQGLFYASGAFDNGSGQFTCDGAIVSGGSMKLSGQLTVNYERITNMPDIGIGGTSSTDGSDATGGSPETLEGGITSVTYVSGRWVEKDLAAFINP